MDELAHRTIRDLKEDGRFDKDKFDEGIRAFVEGLDGKPPISNFFRVLKRMSKPKWRKAVKEFYKAAYNLV